MNQYPKVRRMYVCACCGKGKATGLVICWPCHNQQKADHDGDYSKPLIARLDRIEQALEKR